MKKICEICGDEYEGRSNQKYCYDCGKNPERTRKHYDRAEKTANYHAGVYEQPKIRYCKECNKEYATYMNNYFCSEHCKNEYRIKNASCTNCGKNLYDMGIIIKNTNGGIRFCSDECEKEYRWNLAKSQKRISVCQFCHKEFIGKDKTFCSKDCMNKARQKGWKPKSNSTTKLLCKRCKKPFITSVKSPANYCESCTQKIRNENIALREQEKLNKHLLAEQEMLNKLIEKENKQKLIEQKKKKNIEKNGLCFYCNTTYANCERIQTNFIYYPRGARVDKGKVLSCPCFSERK